MKIKPEQLQGHFKQQGMQPIYLVSGDEQLLVQEIYDQIRAVARQQGFTEREVLIPDAGFEWDYLLETNANLSLFGDKKIIELKLSQFKMTETARKTLIAYAESASPDNVLIIVCSKLDASAQKAKWVKKIDSVGALVQVWPINAKQLPHWIKSRMTRLGLKPTPMAIQWLADRVEGNLLAAAQEIEKLELFSNEGVVDEKSIQACVGNSARYDVFKLIDTSLLGNVSKSLKILNSLKSDGNEPTIILWAFSKEIRQLINIRQLVEQGNSAQQAFQQYRVWDNRKPLLQSCLKRHSIESLNGLLMTAASIDHAIKGLKLGSPWVGLSRLTLQLASSDRQQLLPSASF